MQHSYVHDHLMLGWYLFGVLLVLLLIIDVLVYKYRQQVSMDKTEYRAAEREGRLPVICKKGRFQHLLTVIFGALCLSLGPAVAYKVNHQPQAANDLAVIDLPAGRGGWTGPLLSEDDWMPEYHGAVTAKQAYIKGADQVTLYLGYYPVQKQGEELINDLNRISNEGVWRTHYPHAQAKKVGHGQVLEQLLTKHTGGEKLVWYWYRVAGRDTTSSYEAKLYQLLGLITGRPQAYLLAVAADIKGGSDNTRVVLRDFVDTMSSPLHEVPYANK
ncbi:MAG: EpsI family protein [Gammaproteobacteria bacterium]|nr:EpsI family protein [Gammaproteobacteria bacterium]